MEDKEQPTLEQDKLELSLDSEPDTEQEPSPINIVQEQPNSTDGIYKEFFEISDDRKGWRIKLGSCSIPINELMGLSEWALKNLINGEDKPKEINTYTG